MIKQGKNNIRSPIKIEIRLKKAFLYFFSRISKNLPVVNTLVLFYPILPLLHLLHHATVRHRRQVGFSAASVRRLGRIFF